MGFASEILRYGSQLSDRLTGPEKLFKNLLRRASGAGDRGAGPYGGHHGLDRLDNRGSVSGVVHE
jgi:hypothetical protein